MPRDWEAFYREREEARAPAFVVRAYGPFAPPGPVLDLAGGLGRNARYFLQRGRPVVLVERSREALRRLAGTAGLELLEMDLEAFPLRLPKGPFAAIVVSYYVNRPLLALLPPFSFREGFSLWRASAKRRPGGGEGPKAPSTGNPWSSSPLPRASSSGPTGRGGWRGLGSMPSTYARRPRATSSAMSRTSGASWSWATSTFIMAMQKGQPVAMTSAPVPLSSR
jgi:hypothetical protein